MLPDVEVAIIGGGAMGAAAAWQLAQRGRDVTLFEQFGPGHLHGSSHGSARIFRLAYPDADYVALAHATLPLWDQLEDLSGRVLRHRVGEVDHGDPVEVHRIAGQLAAAGIQHQVVAADEATRRWPGLRLGPAVVFHPDGGTVDAAATVAACLGVAGDMGARVCHDVAVVHLQVHDDHVVVHTSNGATSARTLVVTAGAWVGHVLAGLVALPSLVVTREQPVHYSRTPEMVGIDWPAFIHYSHDGPPKTSGIGQPVWGYGLPTPDGRIKAGEHHTGEVVGRIVSGRTGSGPAGSGPSAGAEPAWTPPVEVATGAVDHASLARVHAYAREWLPGVDPATAVPERCLYTTTDTTDFILDRVGPVVVGAGFSGHGFKFVPRIGQVLADMVDGAPSPAPRFHLTR